MARPMDSILDMDMEEGYDRNVAVDFRGSALCIKHAARAMVKRQVRGSIICTGSLASVLEVLGGLGYAASKHGLVGLVRATAKAVLFFASDESSIHVSDINSAIVVDGGFTVDNSIAMIVSQMLMKEKQYSSLCPRDGDLANRRGGSKAVPPQSSSLNLHTEKGDVGGADEADVTPRPRLEGKVAIITGAASGIGEAAAKLFVENGAFVVVADIQEELGLKVVASIAGPDVDRAIYKKCDVTVEKQVEEIVAFAIEKYGTLDIMYSNAGILGPMDSILDMDMEDGFDRTMAVNLRGPALCIKHAARAMVKRQVRGSIICTASSVRSGRGGSHRLQHFEAWFGGSAMGINNASGIEALASSAANLKGVALNAKHIAEAALFLASNESSVYVSGHNLVVDGGYTVVNNSITILEGKVAIITGAASGIGEAAAKLFVENGAFVVVADIQEELGLKVVASIAGPDVDRAIYKKCDVTVEKQVEETVAFAIEKYGTLDIMYSNAGILARPMDNILDMDMEDGFDRTMAVNLRGPRCA
ncbi:hypothetical protein RHGRI_018066 [Rhododendron griersonianum]|uniref:Uncharacterized protein n=1 Tax=Rhododendron griersonianum TaxID=479676 RepID=A0AAV6K037_9ERIC|nr:hypothetical protein RHGRI_018066 [Rhododendron griersonianum]